MLLLVFLPMWCSATPLNDDCAPGVGAADSLSTAGMPRPPREGGGLAFSTPGPLHPGHAGDVRARHKGSLRASGTSRQGFAACDGRRLLALAGKGSSFFVVNASSGPGNILSGAFHGKGGNHVEISAGLHLPCGGVRKISPGAGRPYNSRPPPFCRVPGDPCAGNRKFGVANDSNLGNRRFGVANDRRTAMWQSPCHPERSVAELKDLTTCRDSSCVGKRRFGIANDSAGNEYSA